MAATDVVVGSLRQPISPASFPTSYRFTSSKPLIHGRSSYIAVSAMASNQDSGASSLHETSSGGSVSSPLRAVQEGGSNAVMKQVSSMKHFFMPELPYAVITEIKKRVPLSFRGDEDDEEEEEGGAEQEEMFEEHVMGARCAWPRSKRGVISEVEDRAEDLQAVVQGPRCAWPRGQGGTQAPGSADMGTMSAMRGAEKIISLSSSSAAGEGGHCKKASALSTQDVEGPRCAWPRPTPRRMLATGVGLGLINYLCAEQGAPALAILSDAPLLIKTRPNQSSLLP